MRGGNEEEQVRYTEGESGSEMVGRESRGGRYREYFVANKGRRHVRREDRHDHGRERAGVIADTMTCFVGRSTRVQEYMAVSWIG
jgi:hypothetical protein